MGRINRKIIAIAAAVLAVLVLGGGIAFAMANNNNSSPASSAAACTTTPTAHAKGKGAGTGDHATQALTKLIGAGISGTLVVADATAPGGYITVTFARGQISSIDTASGQITVQLANNTTQTFTLGPSAQIQIGKKTGTIASLQTGMSALVISRQAHGQPATISVLVQKASGSSNNASATPSPTNNG